MTGHWLLIDNSDATCLKELAIQILVLALKVFEHPKHEAILLWEWTSRVEDPVVSWRWSITQVIEENSRPLDGRERKKIEHEEDHLLSLSSI